MEINFTIPGPPKGKQRPRMCRVGGRTIVYTPKQTSDFEKLVKSRYLAVSRCFFEKDIPLKVNIVASFPIPSKFLQKKKEMCLSQEILPTKKPDCDNVIKIILDGLNGVAYQDDAQICEVEFQKKYAEISQIEVKISEIKEQKMKTFKIYNDEKEIYNVKLRVNCVYFKGKIYGEFKQRGNDGVGFTLRISNGKNAKTGEWRKSTFANCTAFGDIGQKIAANYCENDEIQLIARYYAQPQENGFYHGFVVQDLVEEGPSAAKSNLKSTKNSNTDKKFEPLDDDDLPF